MSDVDDAEEARLDAWYERKSEYLASRMGEQHNMVGHAIIPWAIGGGLDLYYYPNGIPGTGIATKELCEVPREGSRNDQFDGYEFVMFTRHPLDADGATDRSTPFAKMHDTINMVLDSVGRYSEQATLNPRETCEFPKDFPDIGGKCLIFDEYASFHDPEAGRFGLMLIMEVFRWEMRYAMENGGQALLDKLKAAGHYPYSDLDREPVVEGGPGCLGQFIGR